jgi:PhoH-like ATPase
MPLPKPPAKKADLLAPTDFESQAAPKSARRTAKPAAAADAQALLELHDGGSVVAAAMPPMAAAVASQPRAPATAAPAPAAVAPRTRQRTPRGSGPARLFVLDTNVLMHDPMSLFRFEEHDVFLPMITLEELDNHKKGMSEVARNARQVSRELDALASFTKLDGSLDAKAGIPLAQTGHREAAGMLFFQTTLLDIKLPPGLPQGKADNQILGVVQSLREQQPGRDVVLVSKDINMRVKARALGLPAEDYFNDKHARRRRPALHRRAAAAGRLLGAPRQDDGELAAGRPHLLPHQRPAGAGAAGQPVRLPRDAGCRAVVRPRHRDHRQATRC